MNSNQKKEELGCIGELLVQTICTGSTRSQNAFDYEKDIIANEKTIEVKTQLRFYSKNAFTINPQQQQKCENVDFLIFVEYDQNSTKIRLWHCTQNKNSFEVFTSKGRRLAYDVDDMKLISILDWPELAHKMRNRSTSTYIQH